MSEEKKEAMQEKAPKQIKFDFGGKEYVLEYNRKSVKRLEDMGFVAEEVTTKPHTMVELLFRGAFMMHHNWVTKEQIEEIYESLTDRVTLITTLLKMYNAVGEYLFDTDDEGETKKANWTTMQVSCPLTEMGQSNLPQNPTPSYSTASSRTIFQQA